MSPRPRTKDRDLPPRVYLHGRTYRFVPIDPATGRNGKPISLGRDKAEAMRQWAALMGETLTSKGADPRTIAGLWERYARDELPRKATATQHSNRQESKKLLEVFGKMPVASIEQHHAIQYLDLRGKASPTQANREIALLRHMLTKATHWAMIQRNPLLGLQYRNAEAPRDRYVTDQELEYAMGQATPMLRALMWIGYLTALRRGDLLRLTKANVTPEGLLTAEQKTGKRALIQWTPDLRRVVQEALDASPDCRLFPVTESAINTAWGRLQRKLEGQGAERFLMRDLRAKHATDFDAQGGDATAQLGHSGRAVTSRHYLRAPRRVLPVR